MPKAQESVKRGFLRLRRTDSRIGVTRNDDEQNKKIAARFAPSKTRLMRQNLAELRNIKKRKRVVQFIEQPITYGKKTG